MVGCLMYGYFGLEGFLKLGIFVFYVVTFHRTDGRLFRTVEYLKTKRNLNGQCIVIITRLLTINNAACERERVITILSIRL